MKVINPIENVSEIVRRHENSIEHNFQVRSGLLTMLQDAERDQDLSAIQMLKEHLHSVNHKLKTIRKTRG